MTGQSVQLPQHCRVAVVTGEIASSGGDRRREGAWYIFSSSRSEDVANVACFLASPAAAFLSGQVIPVNGGFQHAGSRPGEVFHMGIPRAGCKTSYGGSEHHRCASAGEAAVIVPAPGRVPYSKQDHKGPHVQPLTTLLMNVGMRQRSLYQQRETK